MGDVSWGASINKTDSSDPSIQGGKAWLEWRGKGIGSSDAAVLLGWSPWKDIDALWKEKLGIWKPTFGFAQKKAMERGKELEPVIRQWFERAIGASFPDGIATHPNYEFMRASFDGVNRDYKNEDGTVGRIIEIKAPNAKDHELAKMGEVTPKYMAQVQYLMFVGGIPHATYVSYGTDDTYATVEIPADPVMQAELVRRAQLFWQHVETKTGITHWEKWERPLSAPISFDGAHVGGQKVEATVEGTTVTLKDPIPLEDPPAIVDQKIEALVAEALQAQALLMAAEAKFDLLKDKLKQIAGDREEVVKGEAVFGWTPRKGAVDYKVIPELIGIDLEQFRKPPTRAFYFERKKS